MEDIEVVKMMESLIEPSFLSGSSLVLQENSAYSSVLIKSPATPYRSGANKDKSMLFCRIKSTKKIRYVAFPATYEEDFSAAGFKLSKIESDSEFVRISIDEFVEKIESAKPALNKIFRRAFSFSSFGCCSRYKECSEQERCIHEDQLYATACMYRKNLESGKNFYKDKGR